MGRQFWSSSLEFSEVNEGIKSTNLTINTMRSEIMDLKQYNHDCQEKHIEEPIAGLHISSQANSSLDEVLLQPGHGVLVRRSSYIDPHCVFRVG